MSEFVLSRFARELRNDLAANARGIVIATLAFISIGTLIYLTNVSGESDNGMNTADFLFGVLLVGGGLMVTSLSWSDIHHPLGRYQTLMLPVSALERFAARWLLTGPLWCLYCIVVFRVFETLANALCLQLQGATMPPLQPGSDSSHLAFAMFFALQPLAFAGAIRFRNYALIRTALLGSAAYVVLAIIASVAVRLVYWDFFDSLFETEAPIRLPLFALVPLVFNMLVALADLWVLYLAWLLLNDHEVRDGV